MKNTYNENFSQSKVVIEKIEYGKCELFKFYFYFTEFYFTCKFILNGETTIFFCLTAFPHKKRKIVIFHF